MSVLVLCSLALFCGTSGSQRGTLLSLWARALPQLALHEAGCGTEPCTTHKISAALVNGSGNTAHKPLPSFPSVSCSRIPGRWSQSPALCAAVLSPAAGWMRHCWGRRTSGMSPRLFWVHRGAGSREGEGWGSRHGHGPGSSTAAW